MKNFYAIRRGDKIKVGRTYQTVLGKSIGRNWCAVRTNIGLIDAKKDQLFEVKRGAA